MGTVRYGFAVVLESDGLLHYYFTQVLKGEESKGIKVVYDEQRSV